MTEWARVRRGPSRYRVSRDGEVKILSYESTYQAGAKMVTKVLPERKVKTRMAKHSSHGKLHKTVNIQFPNRQSRSERVDVLVAEAFLGCPFDREDQKEVQSWTLMHIDGDENNCAADNLEWVHAVRKSGSAQEAQAAYEDNLRAWHRTKQNPAAAVARVFKDAA